MTYKSWKKFTNISPEDRSEEIIELLKLLEYNLAMFSENAEHELYEQMRREQMQGNVHVQSEQIPARRSNLLHRMIRFVSNMF
jgi:hypothetical protein